MKSLIILLLVCLPLEIIGWCVLIPAVYFAKGYKLPRLLRWFDNADQYIGRDTSTYIGVVDSGKLNQYLWLAFRNPINYFGYRVLGVCPQTAIEAIYETQNTTTVGDTSSEGFYHCEAVIDGIRRSEYYLVKAYPGKKTCFRFRMGHKIQRLNSNPIGSYIQYVFCIQPYKSYTGL